MFAISIIGLLPVKLFVQAPVISTLVRKLIAGYSHYIAGACKQRVDVPAYSSSFAVGSGFNQLGGAAVDGAGNVADSVNGSVEKIPVGGGTPVSIGSGFLRPQCSRG